jgi:hypothetical protein
MTLLAPPRRGLRQDTIGRPLRLVFFIEKTALPVACLSFNSCLFYSSPPRLSNITKVSYYPLTGALLSSIRLCLFPIQMLIFTFTWLATLEIHEPIIIDSLEQIIGTTTLFLSNLNVERLMNNLRLGQTAEVRLTRPPVP